MNKHKGTKFRIKLTAAIAFALALSLLLFTGCSKDAAGTASFNEHKTGSMTLEYATQFHVDSCEDGIYIVSIEDGLNYALVPDEEALPEWLSEKDLQGMTVISIPASDSYVAASSSMDLINAIDCLDDVVMTSTAASDWDIPEIKEKVESGDIEYIGKYRSPDYEALVEEETGLAIESTMIYHNPQVKEAIEELGIPVLVERSSYESHPLGRLEWIKLYGLIFGKEDEAEDYFSKAEEKIASVDTSSISEPPSVAFFSVNSSGSVVVRKPGDYVTKMIEMAGGSYALGEAVPEEENALSTMNMQMEAFYDMAVDSDILIYNSAIESDLEKLSDLTALSGQFKDFRAVNSGNVWCTNKSMFQKTTGAADMIVEMNRIFAGETDDSGFEYFHKLK